MSMTFNGSSMRLARVFSGLSLEEVAERVSKTRQYLHKLETGQSTPTDELLVKVADVLNVETDFFAKRSSQLHEQQFHFRSLLTTKVSIRQVAIARAEMVRELIELLEKELKLPDVNFPCFSDFETVHDIERIAEECRKEWDLGLGPVDNVTRLAENLGALVTTFSSISKEVDALSVALDRPIIVRNTAKTDTCRQRFDIAHEIGHLVMHEGVVTGDRLTESQANRFASAFLLPRSMMAKLFPRPRGSRLDWRGIREFKLNWKVSKAAILYRARQLDLITDKQYKSGVITLRKYGESSGEKDDYLIAKEPPELLINALKVLCEQKAFGIDEVARKLGVKRTFFEELTGLKGQLGFLYECGNKRREVVLSVVR
ncbi:XRE family transcriptional regulator [Marinobacter sp.]|jgi:Zn-dependent peptidase ImmA (M78 family)/DNA-binding XRE family transcriptional regulator|uniref:helix-turn-helix domain-containing protein n=1 Tax=Marinobacter sp. TaxID=50741 RepID=UPI000C954AC3|nr:XRE family transcriptional regulator [Marinobacter sp.]MAB50248.1 DNA-binding protein [Marinobacter sp.]|tara:strand:+ start:751 stop:1866 length:1116 start_codon:yes stop_codon:yes gene_type:complete